jgi:hypothetical protein
LLAEAHRKRLASWARLGCAVGPDPFDHAPVLHAARLGCFDYAVVRQWAADAFFDRGLLTAAEWDIVPLTEPVPDFVVLASHRVSAAERASLQTALVTLRARKKEATPPVARVFAALAQVGIAGFEPLSARELERLRRRYGERWPGSER